VIDLSFVSEGGADEDVGTGEVAITKKVRKRVKKRTRTAKLKLKLNRTGRKLLRHAAKRGEGLTVRVHVLTQRGGQTSELNYLVNLVKKKKTQ
jgi:hypothetical protein